MKIKQYVYFAIASKVLTGEEMAAQIGLMPDRIQAIGSRRENPPRPSRHRWEVGSYEPGLTISEHVERVLARLEPARSQIRALVGEGEVEARLQLVRYLDAEDGEEEIIVETPEGLIKLPGQHQLLGWRLDRETIAFLHDVGAEVDADEYG